MRKLSLVILAITCLFGGWTTPTVAQEEIVIATRQNAITNRFAELVLKQAYGEVGIPVRFQVYPDARSIIEADLGRADGEMARLEPVLKQYPNLRKVPVPIFYSELSAFVTADHTLKITDWGSLNGLSLATIQGFKYVQNKTAAYKPRIYQTSDKVIEMVRNNRIDVGVLNRFLGQLAAKRMNAEHVVDISPPLDRLPVFHMVHKRHETLIPKLSAVLEKMRASGELNRMWEKFTHHELEKAAEVAGLR